ncbi:MAG: PDZ domain-containing protein, partial [Rhodocyclaceae bacterium]|nr:PDZ domain-containing protein [Rhodocyclaceae bacterium]
NSGGPLINMRGEVVGINNQIYSRSGGFMGISFAIPIDVALKVERQLVEHGSVQRGKLGITIQSVTQELAQNFGLKQPTGALVANVEPGSAAERAGMQAGDVVLDVDGETVNDSGDLPRIIGEKTPGAKVRVKVWRNGAEKTVDATLDQMQSSSSPSAAKGQNDGGSDKLGVSARALTENEARRLNLKPGQGVLVQSADGAAARAGIRSGDVLLAVNNQPVDSVATLRRLVDAAGKQFALLVQRGEEGRIFVAVKLN